MRQSNFEISVAMKDTNYICCINLLSLPDIIHSQSDIYIYKAAKLFFIRHTFAYLIIQDAFSSNIRQYEIGLEYRSV